MDDGRWCSHWDDVIWYDGRGPSALQTHLPALWIGLDRFGLVSGWLFRLVLHGFHKNVASLLHGAAVNGDFWSFLSFIYFFPHFFLANSGTQFIEPWPGFSAGRHSSLPFSFSL